tara:strand:- start:1115 stop:2782 length:1668 start_codon:yes stop_codon:yes gene_type:complete
MADGPSREERRAYANAGKDQFYEEQENVIFPQVIQDLYGQVGQRGTALDQWAWQQKTAEDQYKDQVKFQVDGYKEQVKAFEKSDEIYNLNLDYIQGAFDSKVNQTQNQYDETVLGLNYEMDAAQRQYDFSLQEAQNKTDQLDVNIDRLYAQRDNINSQLGSNETDRLLQLEQSANQRSGALADNSLEAEKLKENQKMIGKNKEYNTQQLANVNKQIDNVRQQKAIRDINIDLQYKETVSSSMFQMLENNLKSIQDQGSVRSRGRQGNSAAKNLQTVIATAGINGARLTDGILRSAEINAVNKKESELQLKVAEDQLDGQTDTINNQRDSLDSDSITNILSINRNKGERTETVEEFRIKDAFIQSDADQKKNSLNYNKQVADSDIDAQALQQDLVAAQLGFEAEQLDMTIEQLGESILSAGNASQQSLDDFARMADQENISAFYARMARPKFSALPEAPYDIDMPKFAPIQKMGVQGGFLNASDSGYLDATRPASGPSGFSQALAIGGAALSLAAIPFTGGTSMIGFGALGSVGASTALGGAGTVLGGLGSSGLFD